MDNNFCKRRTKKTLPMFPPYLNPRLNRDWEASTWDGEAAMVWFVHIWHFRCWMLDVWWQQTVHPSSSGNKPLTIIWKIRGWSGMIITAPIDLQVWVGQSSEYSDSLLGIITFKIDFFANLNPSWTIPAIALSYWGNQAHQSLHKIRHDRAVLLAKSSKASNVMAPATCQLHILWCVRWTHDIGLRKKAQFKPGKEHVKSKSI